MAIADKFYKNGHEKEFELELLLPDGSGSGLKVWVKDFQCDAVVAVDQDFEFKSTEISLKYSSIDDDGKIATDIPEDVAARLQVELYREKYIAAISRWDFNGEGIFDDEDPDPECNHENKSKLMMLPGVANQIKAKILEISNFTKPSSGD